MNTNTTVCVACYGSGEVRMVLPNVTLTTPCVLCQGKGYTQEAK